MEALQEEEDEQLSRRVSELDIGMRSYFAHSLGLHPHGLGARAVQVRKPHVHRKGDSERRFQQTIMPHACKHASPRELI